MRDASGVIGSVKIPSIRQREIDMIKSFAHDEVLELDGLFAGHAFYAFQSR